jgi:predicted PurR-regulated permease PerM
MDRRIELTAQIALIAILVIGCFFVLRPFLAATLFAASVCISSWPLYAWLRNKLGGRHGLAAGVMTLALVMIGLVPFILLVTTLVDDVPAVIERVRELFAAGPPEPPAWLAGLPLVGSYLDESWHRVTASHEEFLAFAKRLLEPARRFLIALGGVLAEGTLQVTLALFIGYFLYRDADAILRTLRGVTARLAGGLAEPVLATIGNTVAGVMYGIVGTALAQGIVAAIGFLIAGVPSALLLGAATFLLSVVPVGPPLVWGGAAIWLYMQDQVGWAVFIVLWGALVVSSIDNFVKPLLISRGAAMPFVLVLLGVFGGVLAFGFIGIFLGPTLLAVGYSLTRKWVGNETPTAPAPGDAPRS